MPSSEKADLYNFRNLALWQRAQDLAVRVVKLASALPREETARVISRQMVRSAGSIGANIAEGHARYSAGAYRNHLSIARGSVAETDSWLDLLHRCGYLPADKVGELHQQCLILLGALTRQMRALERMPANDGRPRVSEDFADYVTEAEEDLAEG